MNKVRENPDLAASYIVTRRPRIVALSGNTRRPSKSRMLSEAIGAAVARQLNCDIDYLDLIDAGPGLGAAFLPNAMDAAARSVVTAASDADGLIVSSPVYKGSYPGLLKHLFDMIEPATLADKPVLLAAAGGGAKHALVIEHQLRPLFGFFTAFTIPTGVYASEADFVDGKVAEPVLAQRVELAAAQFAKIFAILAEAPAPVQSKVA